MWVNLGLPVPMARVHYADGNAERRTKICLHPHSPDPGTLWGDDRVPTWVMEKGGFLFVRVYEPRRDRTWVDVVQGGTVEQVRTVGGPAVRDLSTVANRMDL